MAVEVAIFLQLSRSYIAISSAAFRNCRTGLGPMDHGVWRSFRI